MLHLGIPHRGGAIRREVGGEASHVFRWLQSHPLRCPGGGAGGCWPSIRAKVLDFLQGQWGATEG